MQYIGLHYAVKKQREAYKEEQEGKEENQDKESTENLSLFLKLKAEF